MAQTTAAALLLQRAEYTIVTDSQTLCHGAYSASSEMTPLYKLHVRCMLQAVMTSSNLRLHCHTSAVPSSAVE